LGFALEIEHVLDEVYKQLDLLSSYKRQYRQLKFVKQTMRRKSFSFFKFLISSLIVHGNDEQPNYRECLLKQIFDLYKRARSAATPAQQEQMMSDIEYVPFEGLTDFFKSAARG